jgi:hypothetical protein
MKPLIMQFSPTSCHFISLRFEKRVLRRIFGPKRDVVMEGWRKLHNEEIFGLFKLNVILIVNL